MTADEYRPAVLSPAWTDRLGFAMISYRVLTTHQLVAELEAEGPFAFAVLHPMVGGIPPALAWESRHLLEHEVLPRLGGDTVAP